MINHVASVQLWGLMAVVGAEGEGTWEKKGLPKRIASFLSVKSLIGRFY